MQRRRRREKKATRNKPKIPMTAKDVVTTKNAHTHTAHKVHMMYCTFIDNGPRSTVFHVQFLVIARKNRSVLRIKQPNRMFVTLIRLIHVQVFNFWFRLSAFHFLWAPVCGFVRSWPGIVTIEVKKPTATTCSSDVAVFTAATVWPTMPTMKVS